jgi:hypothetical protein
MRNIALCWSLFALGCSFLFSLSVFAHEEPSGVLRGGEVLFFSEFEDFPSVSEGIPEDPFPEDTDTSKYSSLQRYQILLWGFFIMVVIGAFFARVPKKSSQIKSTLE